MSPGRVVPIPAIPRHLLDAPGAVEPRPHAHCYWLTPGGVLGAGTESTVRSVQNSQSLTVDGIVGPTTGAALEG